MRSESLIRLDAEPRQYNNEGVRQEIAAQVQAFLDKGGEIQRIPSHVGTAPVFPFGFSADK